MRNPRKTTRHDPVVGLGIPNPVTGNLKPLCLDGGGGIIQIAPDASLGDSDGLYTPEK